jgi:hypothetical protein
MMQEAEKAIEETRNLMKMKREKLLMNYVEGRDSIDMG